MYFKTSNISDPSSYIPPELLHEVLWIERVLKRQIKLVLSEARALLHPPRAREWLIVAQATRTPNIHLEMFHQLVKIVKPSTDPTTVWLQSGCQQWLGGMVVSQLCQPSTLSSYNPAIWYGHITVAVEGHCPVEKAWRKRTFKLHNNPINTQPSYWGYSPVLYWLSSLR